MELNVLFATSEMTPFAKTGGLADVSTALPVALDQLGCRTSIVLPGYAEAIAALQPQRLLTLQVLGRSVAILRARHGSLNVYLVADERFAQPGGPYGEGEDHALRFAVFARAVAALVQYGGRVGCPVDVLHLNDWPAALAAGFVQRGRNRPKIVFSIHNLAYQGLFSAAELLRLELPQEWWSPERLEFHGRLSFIKAGLVFADAVTTVSPGYATEIQQPEHGMGLDGLIRHIGGKLHGIRNGIDVGIWNPATDPHLAANYDCRSLERKLHNKRALQHAVGLHVDDATMLLGFIGRLVSQKGIDLITGAAESLLALPAQIVVLGTGELHYMAALAHLAALHPGRFAFVRGFDEPMAHLIEAGADVFMMPSRFEPCGLNQMYSMRYGTVPLVRRTGGLADTVRQVWGPEVGDGTGFLFDDATPEALAGTLRPVAGLYREPRIWQRIQKNGMGEDFSWAASALRYRDLYVRLVADGSR